MSVYTKLHRSIWSDADFLRLPASAQRTYLMLISQPDISHCGVLAMTIRRWSTLAADTTVATIEADLVLLEQARFVICDHTTEELLVRSYMVYDGLSRVHNGEKAIASAADRVISPVIREAVSAMTTRTPAASVKPTRTTSRAPREAPTEAPTEAPSTAPSELAQPAASRKQKTESSQQPAADTARQAIDAWIRHRCDQPTVRNKAALARTLQAAAAVEHGTAISDYLSQHPDADWQQVCMAVLGMSELDCYRVTI